MIDIASNVITMITIADNVNNITFKVRAMIDNVRIMIDIAVHVRIITNVAVYVRIMIDFPVNVRIVTEIVIK